MQNKKKLNFMCKIRGHKKIHVMFYYDKKEHKKHKLGNNEVGSLQGVGDIGLKEYRKQ